MSDEDKSGFEVNSSGCDILDIMHIDTNDGREARDLGEALRSLATIAHRFEDATQRLPITVFRQCVLASCAIFLPCGHFTQVAMNIPWDGVAMMTDEEMEVGLKRLLEHATAEANKHTAEHGIVPTRKGKKDGN